MAQLKPQDFLVALKLVAWGSRRWTYASLAQALGLSASEAHACIRRGLQAGLLVDNALLVPPDSVPMGVQEPAAGYRVHTRPRRARLQVGEAPDRPTDNPAHVNARHLAEFALHGAKYAFFAERLPVALGVPTSHSAPAFANVFVPGSDAWVWPHPQGTVRGQGLMPLHPSVPYAAMQDEKLYEMLALFDALRVGRARERGMAMERLPALIYPEGPAPEKRSMHG
ncbi:MarR family transcriptional regulator [Ramlibacter sp. 2FC]|uniref:MarR family transcriptional regulator n=1 Tax=Ramlibacter sp. 2FC TaxID=2502188 RepID=UPI0010F9FD03|nr:MarR family transcriptional regulator [Ramlibacter sp. 2FC]